MMPAFVEGQRVRMVVTMTEDPDPITAGTEGTVMDVRVVTGIGPAPYQQVAVSWDNGRTLAAVVPPDVLEVIA